MKYQKHIFFCTNDKDGGKKCCGLEHGMKMVVAMQAKIKEEGLVGQVRAQKSGCLDICKDGPGAVVYPEGIFYGNLSVDDIDEIFESHIKNNKPVERLKLDF